ncbi:hypothetical protein [Spirosoma litoris]
MPLLATVTGLKEEYQDKFDWKIPEFPFKVRVIQSAARRSAFDEDTLVVPIGMIQKQTYWPGWFNFAKK